MAIELPKLGDQGDSCPECGSVLATDQRYCLNCGWRRAEPRVDYTRELTQVTPAVAGGPGAVLIGNDNDDPQVISGAAAPATTTTAAAAVPTTPTTATPTKTASKAPATAPGAGQVEKGGSGSTEGVGTADLGALEEAAKEGKGKDAGAALPDQVATQGEQVAQDPNGPVGGGSGSTCIGC